MNSGLRYPCAPLYRPNRNSRILFSFLKHYVFVNNLMPFTTTLTRESAFHVEVMHFGKHFVVWMSPIGKPFPVEGGSSSGTLASFSVNEMHFSILSLRVTRKNMLVGHGKQHKSPGGRQVVVVITVKKKQIVRQTKSGVKNTRKGIFHYEMLKNLFQGRDFSILREIL